MSKPPDLTALHRSELEALAVSHAKLLERFRRSIANIVREFEDEGDRVYLGSTNDADDLRELDKKLHDAVFFLGLKYMHGTDLYADLRTLRKTQAALVAALHTARAQIVCFSIPVIGPDAAVKNVEYIDTLLSQIGAA